MATGPSGATRIGILGSGDVAQALGRGLAQRGHEVKLSSRDPSKRTLQKWLQAANGKGSVGSFADAAAFGQLVIVATNGRATEGVIKAVGPKSFSGKTVIDATNPLDNAAKGLPGLFTGAEDSLGERIQRLLPEARVVKCFNTISHSQMVEPRFADGAPKMMIAGNDAKAKHEVESLLKALGWPGALDAGDISAARYLEALVPLWVRIGLNLKTWGHGFKVVT